MKTIKLLMIVSLMFGKVSAQNNSSTHLNFGTSFGSINPVGLEKNIYRNFSSLSRFVFELEKGFRKKGAWQTGVQLSMISMSVDAILHANNHLAVAPDSIKYAAINQMSLQVPLRYRFYKNAERDRGFYQVGVTLGYAFNNTYTYRYKNENKERNITEAQPFQCNLHIGLGTRIKKKHIVYMDWSIPVTPYFKQVHASSIYPMQLSFNVLL